MCNVIADGVHEQIVGGFSFFRQLYVKLLIAMPNGRLLWVVVYLHVLY